VSESKLIGYVVSEDVRFGPSRFVEPRGALRFVDHAHAQLSHALACQDHGYARRRLVVTRGYAAQSQRLPRPLYVNACAPLLTRLGPLLGEAPDVVYQQVLDEAEWVRVDLYETCESQAASAAVAYQRQRRTTSAAR
jgi:hypothetical protein